LRQQDHLAELLDAEAKDTFHLGGHFDRLRRQHGGIAAVRSV
jgi:hypothetical protein